MFKGHFGRSLGFGPMVKSFLFLFFKKESAFFFAKKKQKTFIR